MTAKTIIHFEDRGQDFTEWHLDEKGYVVKCEPFQGWVWEGAWVVDYPEVKIGMRVAIITKGSGRIKTLNYPIVKIEQVE